MSQAKSAAKGKRRRKAISALGIAGVSLATAAGDDGAYASTGGSAAEIPSQNHIFMLGEEEISDVSLATFYVFDKENARSPEAEVQVAYRGCGGCRGCRGCAVRACRGCGGCRACAGCRACRACGGCGGCGCCLSWGACRVC